MPGSTNNSDVVSALNQIIVVLNEISAKCCSCSNSGMSLSNLEPLPVQPSIYPTPPAGFSSWEAYRNYQCKVANWLFDSFQQFFSQANAYAEAAVNVGTTVGPTVITPLISWAFLELRKRALAGPALPLTTGLSLGFLLALLSVETVIALAALVAAVVVATFYLEAFFYFGNIATNAEGKKTEIVCALYNAPDTAAAQTIMINFYQEIIDDVVALIPAPQNSLAQLFSRTALQIMNHLVTFRAFNKLFELDENLLTYTGTNPVDCAGCTEKLTMILTYYNNITYGSVVEIYDNGLYETLPDGRISITSNHFKLQSNLFSFQQYQFQ